MLDTDSVKFMFYALLAKYVDIFVVGKLEIILEIGCSCERRPKNLILHSYELAFNLENDMIYQVRVNVQLVEFRLEGLAGLCSIICDDCTDSVECE